MFAGLGVAAWFLFISRERKLIPWAIVGFAGVIGAEMLAYALATGDPLLTMTRRAFDSAGTPVEFGDHCYRADQYAFDITVHER